MKFCFFGKIAIHKIYYYLFFFVSSLIFGGTFPHYFYQNVEHILAHAGKAKQYYMFLIERLVYAPIYQVVSLYFLSRFEVRLRSWFETKRIAS